MTAKLESRPSVVFLQVVVARGDGSFWWEETANRTIEVPEGGGLSVTCRMGDAGATEVGIPACIHVLSFATLIVLI